MSILDLYNPKKIKENFTELEKIKIER